MATKNKMKKRNMLMFVLPYINTKKNALESKITSYLAFPYGTMSISNYVKRNSKSRSEVKVIDLNIPQIKEVKSEIKKQLRNKKYDIVGFSFMFDPTYKWIYDLSKIVKGINSDIPVVVGGPAATISHDAIIEDIKYVDAVCYAEGEKAICDLLDSNNLLEGLEKDPWCTRLRNTKPTSIYVNDLDEVFDLDYDTVDMAAYSQKESFSPYNLIFRRKKRS